MSTRVDIVNKTKATLPRVAFNAIKEAILGKDYDLTLIIAPDAEIKKLNKIYRDIDKPTDILSFPVSTKEGDIYISVTEAKKEAKKFNRTYENFLAFLFIHGCAHLKGHDHGSTMERLEREIRDKFKI